jgi:hypothetical protein
MFVILKLTDGSVRRVLRSHVRVVGSEFGAVTVTIRGQRAYLAVVEESARAARLI